MKKNLLHSNQTYKYSVTAKDYRHSLIETAFNPTFVDSCIKYRGLFIFLNTNKNTLFVATNNYAVLLYILFKAEQKAIYLRKYKHKTCVDYL